MRKAGYQVFSDSRLHIRMTLPWRGKAMTTLYCDLQDWEINVTEHFWLFYASNFSLITDVVHLIHLGILLLKKLPSFSFELFFIFSVTPFQNIWSISSYFLLIYIFKLFTYKWGEDACQSAQLKVEDNLWVLSSQNVGPRNWTWVVKLGSRYLYPLRPLTSLW